MFKHNVSDPLPHPLFIILYSLHSIARDLHCLIIAQRLPWSIDNVRSSVTVLQICGNLNFTARWELVKPGFPLPPNRQANSSGHSSAGPTTPLQMPGTSEESQGSIPPIETVNGKLTEDETSFVLRTTLLPEHREDPNVLRFIAAYVRCRDARQAAREANLDPRSGPNLRSRPDIHHCITKLTEKSVMKYGFDASEVIEKVKEIAGIDPIEFVNPDGSYKTDMSEIAPESRRAIKKFKAKNLFEKDPNGMDVKVGVLIEVELWDKMKAVELLGREKELFKETKKVEHDVSSNMASFLLESQRRADERLSSIAKPIEIEARRVTDADTSEG